MADGQVIFEITADGKHAIASVKDVTKAIDNETKKWDKATEGSTDKMDNSFKKVLGSITASLAAAGIVNIIKSWGTAAIEAASDLREVQNVVDSTFGANSTKIEKWSQAAGKQFGLSETQAKKFTSTLGAMMKSAGLAGDEIVGMSTDLAGLSADMSSFYNLDFDTAFQKIRAGISGETEPLKQLGINMSVANLNAFALEKGLNKTFDQMSQGEQITLRYQYLMKATADAQGDFAKTSDGYANAQRRINSALENIKANVGKIFLPAIDGATSAIAGFLEKLTEQPESTVLDTFNDIELNTARKIAQLDDTMAKANSVIDAIKEIEAKTVEVNGKTISLSGLMTELQDIEKNGGNVLAYLEDLGVDVDYVSKEYAKWKVGAEQLNSLIPGFTDNLDKQAVAMKGLGSAASDSLIEWNEAEVKKLRLSEYYAKQRALKEKEAEMAVYDMEVAARKNRYDKALNALSNKYGSANIKVNADMTVDRGALEWSMSAAKWEGPGAEGMADWEHVNILAAEYAKAMDEANRQLGGYNEAKAMQVSLEEALKETYGDVLDEVKGLNDSEWTYLDKTKKEWLDKTQAIIDATTALDEYVASVKESTAASVNGTLSGFSFIKSADQLYKEAANDAEDLTEKIEALKKKGLTETEIQITLDAENAQVTLTKMNEALQSQLDFIQEYKQNLEEAEKMGINKDLLSDLSDGSVASAQQLYAIVHGTDEQRAKLNELYESLNGENGAKSGFVDVLTKQKLEVDKVYQDLVQGATDAINSLAMGGEAEQSLMETVQGIATGINDGEPEVRAAVDSIIRQLERLNNYGMGWKMGLGGMFTFFNGSHANGLDYVPFDGYIAKLHEGEGVLRAEENKIWQRFKTGQLGGNGLDYETLGGVMRDNVHAGGNVYLDGRTVGQVMSKIQGDQYRALTRSGWQNGN